MIVNGIKRIHTQFPDKTEMIEEFDGKSELLVLRKVKVFNKLGSSKWNYEVGTEPRKADELIRPNPNTPECVRRDTKTEFCWKIRNLKYPADCYKLAIDGKFIIVSTTIKK